MTKHLSKTEFVDFAEGTLNAARAAHLQACEPCRGEAEVIRIALRDAAGIEIPEPSPLFWDHLSARVRDGLAAESPQIAWWRRPVAAVATATVLITVLMIAVTLRVLPHRTPTPDRSASPTARIEAQPKLANSGTEPSASSPSNDPAWTLLREAASDMRLDEARAAGFSVRPGSVEAAVLDLTPTERGELERLLRRELKRAGA